MTSFFITPLVYLITIWTTIAVYLAVPIPYTAPEPAVKASVIAQPIVDLKPISVDLETSALLERNIKLNNVPPELVKRIHKIIFLTDAKDLTIAYQPAPFLCANTKGNVGCFNLTNRELKITDKIYPTIDKTMPVKIDSSLYFEFALVHELAHSLGIYNEKEADDFAYIKLKEL
jgi:hypothetical protein